MIMKSILMSILSFTIAVPILPVTITKFVNNNLLDEYIEDRKDQLLRCVEKDTHFRQTMNGTTITVLWGPSSVTLLGVRPENRDHMLIQTQVGNVFKAYILMPRPGICSFFQRGIVSIISAKINEISKFQLKNVYKDDFDTRKNMTQIFNAKGSSDLYYGFSDVDEAYLRHREYSLEEEAYLEKEPNDNHVNAIRPAGIQWRFKMPWGKEEFDV
jgi:hypothetical protein